MVEKIKFYSMWIALLLIVVYFLQVFLQGFTEFFILTQDAFMFPWKFLSAIFLHADLIHLLYNLFALIFFGLILEKLIGSRRFIYLFMISGILVNVISFSFYPSSLGASGAIMAVLAVVAVLRPLMMVWAFGIILPMFLLALIWAIGSVMGVFGLGDSGVGHIAHLSGLVIGAVYGFYLRVRKNKHLKNSVHFKSKIILPENYMQSWENRFLKG